MEQNPFSPSADAENTGSDSKDKKSDGFGFAARQEQYAPPVRPERTVPAAPAVERLVSLWDRNSDELRRSPAAEADTTSAEESESEEGENKERKQKAQPRQPIQPAQRPYPPVDVLPVGKARQEAADEEDSVADEAYGAEPVAQLNPEFAAYYRQEATGEQGEEDDTQNHADDVHARRPVSTPTVFSGAPLAGMPPIAPVQRPRNEFTMPVHDTEPEDNEPQYASRPAGMQVPPQMPPTPDGYNWPAAQEATPAAYEDEDAYATVPVSQPPITYSRPPSSPDVDGNQPPVPPTVYAANQALGPGGSPNYYANQYTDPNTAYANQYNMAPSAPNAAPAMPIEHPLQTGNRDPRLGPTAALLGLGLWAEHRGRKKADRRLEKADAQTNKRIEQQGDAALQQQRQMMEQQRLVTNEHGQQHAELQRLRQQQERLMAPPAKPAEQFSASMPNIAPPVGYAPRVETAPGPVPLNEQQRRQQQEMRPPAPVVVNPEQQQAEITQNYNVNPSQHVEHSAWHNIVVDNRGHEVAGAIQYGEGFQRERQQEIIRDRMGDGAQQGNSAAAQGQYQQQSQYGMYSGALPSGMTTPSLPQGQPTHVDPQHQLEAQNRQPASNMTNPWFWIMILLIVAAFFTAAFI